MFCRPQPNDLLGVKLHQIAHGPVGGDLLLAVDHADLIEGVDGSHFPPHRKWVHEASGQNRTLWPSPPFAKNRNQECCCIKSSGAEVSD